MSDQGPKNQLSDALELVRQSQAQFEEKLKDPQKRRAWDLVQAGEKLFWSKQYDQGIQMLVEAAVLDPEYGPKVEAYRKTKLRELRKGRVSLRRSVNRILLPRLTKLGMRVPPDEPDTGWQDGVVLVWHGGGGRQGSVLMGRTKGGKQFGLNVARDPGDGKWQYLDLSLVGLGPDALSYMNQSEADEVLGRVAVAFEGPIVAWLNGRDSSK